MNIRNKYLLFTLLLLISAAGCKKALNVNQNPNVANNVTSNLLLPSIEVTLGNTLGVNFQIYGGIWGQYWTQNPNSSQYRELERYQPTSPDFDRPWTNLYAGAGADLNQLEKISGAANQKQYQAIALLLKAYMFQMITDAWGDVPYSEALSGDPADGGIVNPKYDLQRNVYTGIINQVDSGLSLIDVSDPNAPGTDDLIYNGDMSKWQRFGNTLKLRMLLRLSEVDPAAAQAGIASLNGASFIDEGDDAQVNYVSDAGNNNPLYSEEVGLQRTQNLVGSSTVIDSMVSNNDPRVGVFFEQTNAGTYEGITQGDFDAAVAPGTYSIPGPAVGADAQDDASATAPVKFLTSYESKFLQAEAVARGWLTGDAATLFTEGIYANFHAYGLATADADTYIASSNWGTYPVAGTMDEQIRYIITQKWFSMTGNQGFEAWTEWRRTGYPDFFVLSVNRLIDEFPVRFLYPDVEITRNLNFPGTQAVTDRVYWDIN